MIEVKNLHRSYYSDSLRVDAIKGISFNIHKGDFAIIYGNSGSGKSTLLHLLGLLDNPSGGSIIFEGKNTTILSETDKTRIRLNDMGFVFQEFNILPEMTALENTILPAIMKGEAKKTVIEKGKKVLKYIGLENRANHLPAELSGGQKQRVSIARSLINNPKILFADEPTANLDSKRSIAIINTLHKMNKQLGLTVLMVTHNPDFLKFASKIIHLEDGIIQSQKRSNPLSNYINNCKRNGISDSKIKFTLINSGWAVDIVERTMENLKH